MGIHLTSFLQITISAGNTNNVVIAVGC